jgi:hypothetical protein
MGGNACLDHAFSGNNRKVEIVTGGMSKPLHKDSLRPAVALAEGMDRVYRSHNVCCSLGEFLARQVAQIVSGAKFFSDAVKLGGNGNANRKWLPAGFSHDWHGCNRAIRKSYALITRAPCPLVDVLKQMFMNRLYMFGALQGLRRHLFRRDVLDQRRLNRFKLGVVRYSEGILDGVRAPVGVVGHALRDAIEELKSGNDLGDLNLAINVSSEDRIGFWVGRDSFDPIIGIAPAHMLNSK